MSKKEKDISFKNVIGNNLNILKMIFMFSPMAFPTYLLISLIRVCGAFISGTYILNYVVSAYEMNKKFDELVLGIIILIVAIKIIGKIVNKEEKPKAEEKVEEKVELPAPTPVVEEGIPEHVKVAIMAAIYAYYSESKEKCEFTVKNIIRRR